MGCVAGGVARGVAGSVAEGVAGSVAGGVAGGGCVCASMLHTYICVLCLCVQCC